MNPPLDISTSRFNAEQIDDREIYFSNLSEGVVVLLDAVAVTRLQATPHQAGAAGSGGSEMLRDYGQCNGQYRQDTPLRLMLNCFHNKLGSGMWIHPGSPHPWLHHCQCTLCKFGKMGLAIHNYTDMNPVWLSGVASSL